MDEREAYAAEAGAADSMEAAGREPALRPDFLDPENWHDLAERGTPRNG
jgi:hypothetical protein